MSYDVLNILNSIWKENYSNFLIFKTYGVKDVIEVVLRKGYPNAQVIVGDTHVNLMLPMQLRSLNKSRTLRWKLVDNAWQLQ